MANNAEYSCKDRHRSTGLRISVKLATHVYPAEHVAEAKAETDHRIRTRHELQDEQCNGASQAQVVEE